MCVCVCVCVCFHRVSLSFLCQKLYVIELANVYSNLTCLREQAFSSFIDSAVIDSDYIIIIIISHKRSSERSDQTPGTGLRHTSSRCRKPMLGVCGLTTQTTQNRLSDFLCWTETDGFTTQLHDGRQTRLGLLHLAVSRTYLPCG